MLGSAVTAVSSRKYRWDSHPVRLASGASARVVRIGRHTYWVKVTCRTVYVHGSVVDLVGTYILCSVVSPVSAGRDESSKTARDGEVRLEKFRKNKTIGLTENVGRPIFLKTTLTSCNIVVASPRCCLRGRGVMSVYSGRRVGQKNINDTKRL